MKVSKTVSIEIDLLNRVIEENPNFSSVVTEALENWLNFKKETERGNTIHFSKSITSRIPPKAIWQLMTFDGIVKWVSVLTKAEYLVDDTIGLGSKCILYGEVDDINITSIAEITEYREFEKMVFRAEGDFRVFTSVSLNTRGPSTEVVVIIVVGLSEELASNDRKEEILKSIEEGFSIFSKLASNIS